MGKTLGLIFRELMFRKANMLLTIAALAATVALCVAFYMTQDAAQRETRRNTRDAGFNLRIVPKETDDTEFYLSGYSAQTMPLDVVHRLAKNDAIAYNHLVATLKQKIEVGGTTAILTGLADTVFPPGHEKPPMHKAIPAGSAELGHQIGKKLGAKKGESIQVGDVPLKVSRVAPPAGTDDDIGLVVNLEDAQKILNLPGQINEIQAIDCLCLTPEEKPGEIISKAVQQVAPEAKIFFREKIATARAKQRRMVEKYALYALPLLLLVGAVWVGALAMINVRQRRTEIGLLQSLGYQGGAIATLFLGRAIILGLIAAGIGYAVGTALGLYYGPTIFSTTAKAIQPIPSLAGWAFLATPLLAAIASLIPATLASTQDPAVVLRTD